jgi:outer membrane protein TolC
VQVKEEPLVATAYEKRSDWLQAWLELEKTGVNLAVARNNLLPQLNLSATYAYFGEDNDASDARDSAEDRDFSDYAVGLEFEFPLQNRAARYDRYQAQLSRDSALLRINNLGLTIRQEIRTNLRSLQTAYKRIQVTDAGIRAEQAKFDSERKRFEVGLSTSFELLDALDDLSLAKVAHLQAIIDYRLALIDLKLAQGIILSELGIDIGAETEIIDRKFFSPEEQRIREELQLQIDPTEKLQTPAPDYLQDAEPAAESELIKPDEVLTNSTSLDYSADTFGAEPEPEL